MLPTPYILIDEKKLDTNIQRMQKRLSEYNIDHWPHMKTHKSMQIAQKQLDAGAKGITCATISELEVLSDAGFNNIFLAYPIVGKVNLKRIDNLLDKVRVRTIVDNSIVANELSEIAEKKGVTIDVLIDFDSGTGRGGVQSDEQFINLATKINNLNGLKLLGVFAYFGDIYGMSNFEEVRGESKRESEFLREKLQLLNENNLPGYITSGGSTLSSFHADMLSGISESRAGNYVFGDLNAVSHGVYSLDDCALKIISMVISVPYEGLAIIDAGSKTLTSDRTVMNEDYGAILNKEKASLFKLNEEHGYIKYNPEIYKFEIGERLEIIPNHGCVITNLNHNIYKSNDVSIVEEIDIEARGKNF